MDTEATYEMKSLNSKETLELGEKIGASCKGGELFVLSSDLGGGKTTFTKGLVAGLGSQDIVTSPTFTVNNIYSCRNGIDVYHYDFYRLDEGGMVEYELQEVINDPNVVIVIEWSGIVSSSLPSKRISVDISILASAADHRLISLQIPKKYSYIGDSLQ